MDSDDSDDLESCPLCCEDLDITERGFRPCKCGYQICLWCWRKISESVNPICPACRQEYKKDNIVFIAPDQQALEKAQNEKKRKKRAAEKARETAGGNLDKSKLYNIRVLQRNLLYVVGLPQQLAKEDVLKRKDGFGKFGKIVKVAVNPKKLVGNTVSYSAYVTYRSDTDAARAIQNINGQPYMGRFNLRATYGTTKYCAYFLRNTNCNNPNCLYLHELAKDEDCVTKDDLSVANGPATTGITTKNRQQMEGGRGGGGDDDERPSLDRRTSKQSSSTAPVVNQWASPSTRGNIAKSISSSTPSDSKVSSSSAPSASSRAESQSEAQRRGWSDKPPIPVASSSSGQKPPPQQQQQQQQQSSGNVKGKLSAAVAANGHDRPLLKDPRGPPSTPQHAPQHAPAPVRQATPQERKSQDPRANTNNTSSNSGNNIKISSTNIKNTNTNTNNQAQYANTNSMRAPPSVQHNTGKSNNGNPPGVLAYTRAIGNERKQRSGVGSSDMMGLDSLFVTAHERKQILNPSRAHAKPFDFNKFVHEMASGGSLFSWSSPLAIMDTNHRHGNSMYSFAQTAHN